MADNVTVGNTPGSADYVVASEELSGGAQLQSVELHTESAGTKAKVGAANPLPISAAALPLPSGAATEATALTLAPKNHPALTASAPAAATVGVASAQAVASNANRKGLVLVNVSGAWVYLGFGATAVLGSGIALGPWGGSWTMGKDTFTTAAVNAIASAAASNVGVQEWT